MKEILQLHYRAHKRGREGPMDNQYRREIVACRPGDDCEAERGIPEVHRHTLTQWRLFSSCNRSIEHRPRAVNGHIYAVLSHSRRHIIL